MNDETIALNRLIAEFMGYIYVEENVMYDVSDELWTHYQPVTIYSKTPIAVRIIDGEKWLDDLPNPDYQNTVNPKFRNDLEKLNWCTLNIDYFTELKYNCSWDWLMPVVNKCCIKNNNRGMTIFNQNNFYLNDIFYVWRECINFIKKLNSKQP